MKKQTVRRNPSPIGWLLQILVVATVASTLPNVAAAAEQPQATKRPNIVFVLADDMGWGDLACYGHPYIKTPNLDRLAKQGALFTSFYVTAPTCSPSRAGFMTGQFPGRLGIHSALGGAEVDAKMGLVKYLDPKTPTITKLLQDAGYKTGHFGKWHLGHTPDAPSPAAYGIDDVKCFMAVNEEALLPNQIMQPKRSHFSEAIVDEGIRFIEENKDRPFYVNVWLTDPHAILDPSEDQMADYQQFHPKGVSDHGAMMVYFAVISEVDKQVGRLLKKLDELNLTENTIVVFSSDNGPEHIGQPSGESAHSGVGSAGPFRGHKHVIYEGGIREPFIVRWPGHTPAGRVDSTTILSGADWLPTLCALTGSKLPAGALDGEDMSQAFLGQAQERAKPLMWEMRYRSAWVYLNMSPELAIREGKWKLLMNPDKSHLELHDLTIDPSEVDNLVDNNPAVVDRLSKELLKWRQSLNYLPIDPGLKRHFDLLPAPYPWPQENKKGMLK
jgi:arylsulfatase A-like enzyme